ncbi:hypothetical protein HMPREF1584_01478 [Gardnerella vaginalis JCP8481A]|nr:hypothetical protein HMPREF1584_01478 [Gardnerella vaginalis JCP8481A]EPI40785.1 hypothetical protein HMPREF1585_01444 [Gardnerella vaginalis JCP8481B]
MSYGYLLQTQSAITTKFLTRKSKTYQNTKVFNAEFKNFEF